MFEWILAGVLVATVVLLIRVQRRMRALEHLEHERAKMRHIINTPRADWLGPPTPEPEGRRKHLSYYKGGAAAAFVLSAGAAARGAWNSHRPVRYTVTAATVAAGAVAAVYYGGVDERETRTGERPGPTPTVTAPPSATSPPPSPAPQPTANRTGRRPTDAGPPEGRDVWPSPGGGEPPAADPTERFSSHPEPVANHPAPPGWDRPDDDPGGDPAGDPSPEDKGRGGVCITITLKPILAEELCLLGDRR